MKVLVLGASGRLGRVLLTRARAADCLGVANRATADRSPVPLLSGTRVVLRAMTQAGTARLIYVSDAAFHEEQTHGATGLLRSVLGHGARRDAREAGHD